MAEVLCLVGAIHVAGLLLVFIAVWRAPRGHEDSEGFHRSNDDIGDEELGETEEPASDTDDSDAGSLEEPPREALLANQERAGSP